MVFSAMLANDDFDYMKDRILRSLLALLIATTVGYAQQDSLVVVRAPWKTQKIARGIIWKQHLFNGDLFNSNQSVNMLEVRKQKKVSFAIGYEEKELKPTSAFGKEADAIAALNGSFFDMKNGGSVDFIKSKGKIIGKNQMKDSVRAIHQKAAIAIQKGILSIEKWNGSNDWETRIPAEDILLSGPLLIFENHLEAIDSSSFTVTRHPRTVVATIGSRILLITIDGRNENAAGMNLFELRNFLRWLNANNAINLDGGGSTTLWIYNQSEGGVVNYPSDNKKWDHAGERKVANVLLVQKRK